MINKVGKFIEGEPDCLDKDKKSNNKLTSMAFRLATIFVIVAPLAVLSLFISIPSSYASGCGVRIITPTEYSHLEGVTTLQGYASYSFGGPTCTTISGDKLTWFLNGEKIGVGNKISY